MTKLSRGELSRRAIGAGEYAEGIKFGEQFFLYSFSIGCAERPFTRWARLARSEDCHEMRVPRYALGTRVLPSTVLEGQRNIGN